MKEAFNAVACVGIGALAVICLCFGPMPALGRAPGNFNNPPSVTAWFNSATSKISRCCDESDGFREGVAYPWSDDQPTVIFEEWAAQGDENHPYKVRILGKWVDVPEAALLIRDSEHGPNSTGTAIVWLWWLNGEPQIPCFAPGDEG
jgi:hypothetical protein